jgi:hypothetical protein
MSIILRSDKGSALTYEELDGNLEQFYISSSLANDRVLSLFTTGGVEDIITFPAADTLQSVTNLGNTTTNNITANSFIKSSATSNDVLLGDGSTTSLSALGSAIDTGSFYISSSVALNTITFTQGDGTTEAVTVNTGSSVTTQYEAGSGTETIQPTTSANNTANGSNSTIAGGRNNETLGSYQFIGAGQANSITAAADYGFIGSDNTLEANYTTIGGGQQNTASGISATVAGGYLNWAKNNYATIGGGYLNNTRNEYATVAGGRENLASDIYSTIGGGYYNTASADYSTIAGGSANTGSGDYSSIGGGFSNAANNPYATIGGGSDNFTSGASTTIGGGASNIAVGVNSTIAGGESNSTTGANSTVGGGEDNTAASSHSVIGGGQDNQVNANHGAILGGQNNTVSTGHDHSSVVAGENVNTTRSDTAFAPSFFASGSTIVPATSTEATMQMTRRSTFPSGSDEELAGMMVYQGSASVNHLYFGRLALGTFTWVQLT